MSAQELEAAVSKLSREDLAAFRKWFIAFDAEAWDRELDEDITAGKLDSVVREVDDDIRAGRLSELPVAPKALALEVIRKLPDKCTFAEIRERIEFMAGVRKGLDQIENAEVETLEVAEKKIEKWATK